MNESLPRTPENGPKRITWSLIGSDILNVLNFEKGVLFTIKGLFLSPKVAVDDYLYGNRHLHANPLRFLLISTAIVSLLNYYFVLKPSLENSIDEAEKVENGNSYDVGKEFGRSISVQFNESKADSSSESSNVTENEKPPVKLEKGEEIRIVKESMKEFFQWMDKFTFATVPIFSVFTFLFFRRSGYNFTENLVINAFMVSMTNVFGILLILPTYYYPGVGGIVLAISIIIYTIYFLKRVFALPGFKGYLRAFATLVLSYTVYVILMAGALIYFIFDYVQEMNL